MKTLRSIWLLVAVWLAVSATGRGATIVWAGSRAQAVQAAQNSGKLILLLAGRDTCGNCQYMKGTVCESASVRAVIDTNYVCWYCLVDSSTEWYPYAGGLGTFTLPLMCVIDPGSPTSYLDRSTATQTPSAFKDRLGSHLPSSQLTVALTQPSAPRLWWGTESQLRYRVMRSGDLTNWVFLGGLIEGTGSPTNYVDSPGAPSRFYRVMGFK